MTKDVQQAGFSHYALYHRPVWQSAMNILATSLKFKAVKMLAWCVFIQFVMVCNKEVHELIDMVSLMGQVC